MRTQHHLPVRICLCLAIILALLSSLLPPLAATAQEPGGLTLAASAGLDGFTKDGRWLPVRVTVENNGPDLEGLLQVQVGGLNNRQLIFQQEVSLPQTSRKELFLYVHPETYLDQITVELLAGGRKVAEVSDRLTSTSQMDAIYGVLAGDASAYNFLNQLKPGNANAFSAYLLPEDLPDHYLGLEPLDALIISGVDTGSLNPAQQEALEGWVARGGKLMIAGGADWRRTSAGLEELLPVLPEDDVQIEALQALAGFTLEEDMPEGKAIAAVGELASGAQVLVRQGEIPLVARRAYGSGEVTFLAVDPALAPLEDWDGLPGLFSMLIDPTQKGTEWESGFKNWDMAHQAASALPDLGLPSGWLVVCFLGIYIVIVGPLNYVILGRLKRRELAWLSIPAFIILFAGVAFSMGSSALGNRPVLNRMALVQVWPGVDEAQVDGLVGLFSPRRDSFDLDTAPGILAHRLRSGVDISQSGDTTVRRDEQGASLAQNLRVDIGGVRSFSVQGKAPAPEIEVDLTMTLGLEWIDLQGRVNLPQGFSLEDAVLLAPSGPQALGNLQQGESREIDTVILSSARAQQAATGQQDPYYYRPYPASADLVNALVGGVDYYSDQRLYRRFSLLNALTDPGYPAPGGWSGGLYLAGWSEEFPLQVGLGGENFKTSGTSLYLMELKPELLWEGDSALLPPALFTWTSFNTNPGVSPSPYDTWVDTGGYSLQFRLAQPIEFSAVEGLTLHLEATPGSGPSRLKVALWDFQEDRWEELGPLDWGEQSISSPERYVGPGGEVRMQLTSADTFGGVQLNRADFSLQVRR